MVQSQADDFDGPSAASGLQIGNFKVLGHYASGGTSELWIAIRGNDDSFGAPVKVFGSSTADDETWPALSEDGATLFYSSWIPGSSNYEKPTVRTRQ